MADETKETKMEVTETKKNKHLNQAWKFIKYSFLVWIAGWILRISTLPPVWQHLFVGISIALLLLDIILEATEGDSALKRFLRPTGKIIFSVMVFILFRWLMGHLFGISLLDTFNGLRKVSALGWLGGSNVPKALVFETSFFIIGALVAWSVAFLKYGRAFGLVVLIAASFLSMAVVKQPHYFNALSRSGNAKVEVQATTMDLASMKKEVEARLVEMEAVEDTVAVPDITLTPAVMVTPPVVKGTKMALIDRSIVYWGAEPMVQVILQNDSGILNGERIFIPFNKIKELPKKTETPLATTPLASVSTTTAPSKNQEPLTPDDIGYIPTLDRGDHIFSIPPNTTLWKKVGVGDRWNILLLYPKPAAYDLQPYGKQHLKLNEINGGFVDITAESLIYGIVNLEKERPITVKVIVDKQI